MGYVFIHPSSLFLLIGVFNPFTFKVIINMYDHIIIFLIFLGLFCVGLFLLLCFLPGEVILAFVVKLVWCCQILLTFACLKSFWFICQIWMRVLLGILGCRFFPFITLNISCHSLLAGKVPAKKKADCHMEVPLYVTSCFSFDVFKSLSLIMGPPW